MSEQTQTFSVIGKSIPRVNGADKVRGRTQFTEDLTFPGMVWGKMKLSNVVHANIKRIDTTKAEALPGVLAVVTGRDTPVPYNVVFYKPTEHPLANEKVRYYGEPVAAVAAVDKRTAAEAVELIEVEYEELPVVVDPQTSLSQDDIRLHEAFPNNLHLDDQQVFGDVKAALEDAHLVLEREYSTNGVHNGFIENHAAIADFNPDNGRLVLHTNIQLPNTTQRILADTLQMPLDKIRVCVPFVGGAFGGKTEPTHMSIIACALSRKIGRPVKMVTTRRETFYINKGRHPSQVKLKMGFGKDGTILGADMDYLIDGGAHTSWGMVIMWFSAALMHLPYKIPNLTFRGRRVLTNRPIFGAQRGVGAVQVRVPVECLLDEAAQKLGMSAIELRLRNAVESGYQTKATVEVRHAEFKKCLESVREKSGFDEKHGKLPYGHGIGLAAGHYSTGGAYLLFNSYRPHSSANVKVDTESGITVFTGITDIGQGSRTVIRQMAAEVFGLSVNDVNLFCQDTMMCPFDNGTYDSRVTYGVGHAVKIACEKARKKLTDFVAAGMRLAPHHMVCREGQIFSQFNPKKTIPFKKALELYHSSVGSLYETGDYTPPQPKGNYSGSLIGPSPAFGFSVQAVEVKVDTDTGHIKILHFWEAGDCGKALNPMSVEGQVHGGISMGIGQSLFEDVVVNKDGIPLNPNFHEYCIPGFLDMPDIDGEIVDSYDPTSAFGSKEIGEGPLVVVPPLFLNAVSDAIGVRMTRLPLTPEVVLRAMGKIQ
jgi:4-hydroxybenzoyl-CoA reductase alpha subunit